AQERYLRGDGRGHRGQSGGGRCGRLRAGGLRAGGLRGEEHDRRRSGRPPVHQRAGERPQRQRGTVRRIGAAGQDMNVAGRVGKLVEQPAHLVAVARVQPVRVRTGRREGRGGGDGHHPAGPGAQPVNQIRLPTEDDQRSTVDGRGGGNGGYLDPDLPLAPGRARYRRRGRNRYRTGRRTVGRRGVGRRAGRIRPDLVGGRQVPREAADVAVLEQQRRVQPGADERLQLL